jgi:phosphoribosylformimino-5-aminoimidazole carboxamide ribotide isomerase
MIAIPAVDLRDGACVQLVGGAYDEERIRLKDPVAVAKRWGELGFKRLHIVDLDCATGRGNNDEVISQMLSEGDGEMQVGGGLRTTPRVEQLLNAGAAFAIVGTRAVTDALWLADIARQFPRRIIVAADVRGRQLATHGWEQVLPKDILSVIDELNALPLAGILVTAVHVEGQMHGPDLSLVEDVVARATLPILASGGVASVEDLRALADRGAAATVIGMALYSGALDARALAEEFAG